MMRRGFTMLVVGSVNSPFRSMTKLALSEDKESLSF